MERISDEVFLKTMPNPDRVVGIRVKDGEFYFLAWMENAPHYKIQQAMNPDGYLLDRDSMIITGHIFSIIQHTKEYNNMYLLYETDASGNLRFEDEAKFDNEYEEFLSLIKCYERDGKSNTDDHDILVLTQDELSSFCDLLRDGDYILVMED